MGVGDLLTRIAQCCNPIPGDDILGFVTRTRGVTVHKRGCPSLTNEDEQERIVSVAWGEMRELYPVRVRMEAYDRYIIIDPPLPLFAAALEQLELWPAMKLHPWQEAAMRRRLVGSKYQPEE